MPETVAPRPIDRTKLIHVWSDYVCPFCLIADEVLDRTVGGRDDVRIVHHPFELRPFPTPTLRPEDDYLPDVWRRAVYPMARRYGVELRLPTVSPQPWTEVAFRGSFYATDQGAGAAYHRRILTAFFRDDLDIGDRDVLTGLAGEIGLDRDEFARTLDGRDGAERHRRALAEAARLEIDVAPTIIIGSRRINGVADVGVIDRALEDAPVEAAGTVPA